MTDLSVSVIIPVYNNARYIGEALESALAQTLAPNEIIVVDDGSTDETADVVSRYPDARLVSRPHEGQSTARNHGTSIATGDLIAFLDADDIWLPEKLAKQVRALAEKPSLGYVLCRMRVFCEPGCEMPTSLNAEHYAGTPAAIIPSALVVRRTVLDKVGLFDPKLIVSEDVDWFARANDMGIEFETLDDVLLQKRIHGHNLSIVNNTDNASLFEALRRSVGRKHQGDSTE